LTHTSADSVDFVYCESVL